MWVCPGRWMKACSGGWMCVCPGGSRWVCGCGGCLLLFRFGHWSVRGTASGCPALANSGSH